VNKPRQSRGTATEQAPRAEHRPLRLAECGDTLSISELCRVMGISRREYFRLQAHRQLPIKPLKALPHRFSAIQVQRFLERGA
jgi:hypothetical protein